jgi:hypothetical protein
MTPGPGLPPDSAAVRPARTRLLASLVLVPAIPLLALSVFALAVFYTAPERFGAWLARLPGDTYLRTALIFAPATLLAVVVLATLYLRDSAEDEERTTQVGTRLARAAKLSLIVTGPLFALVGALRAAAYLDPKRVHGWLDALPATTYLTRALELGPLALALAVGVGVLLGYAPVESHRQPPSREVAVGTRPWTRARMGRLAAEVVLALATPALLLSMLGLGLQWLAPERLARWLEPLPGDTYLRLLVTLAPAGLLAVLLIDVLYLLGPLDPARTRPMRVTIRRGGRGLRIPAARRSDLAMIVLVGGLVLAVATGALLVGGTLLLLVMH